MCFNHDWREFNTTFRDNLEEFHFLSMIHSPSQGSAGSSFSGSLSTLFPPNANKAPVTFRRFNGHVFRTLKRLLGSAPSVLSANWDAPTAGESVFVLLAPYPTGCVLVGRIPPQQDPTPRRASPRPTNPSGISRNHNIFQNRGLSTVFESTSGEQTTPSS